MSYRIKEQQDNVVYVDFTPDEEDSKSENEKMFEDFLPQQSKNHNMVIPVSIVGIVMSFIVFSVLLLASLIITS